MYTPSVRHDTYRLGAVHEPVLDWWVGGGDEEHAHFASLPAVAAAVPARGIVVVVVVGFTT